MSDIVIIDAEREAQIRKHAAWRKENWPNNESDDQFLLRRLDKARAEYDRCRDAKLSMPPDTAAAVARQHVDRSTVGTIQSKPMPSMIYDFFRGLASPWQMRKPLAEILQNQEDEMALLDDIKTALATETADEEKLTAVLTATLASNKDLSDKLAAAIAANDPAALAAIKTQIDANNAAMEKELALVPPG